jgi:Holliday junction resolvase
MRPHDLIRLGSLGFAVLIAVAGTPAILAQTRAYPDNIRGYKVERTVIEVKSAKNNTGAANNRVKSDDSNVDQLITFGKPALARVTPLGITFEVPIVVAPVTQNGKVDFLVFEDIEINGHSVDISEYNHSFNLPGNAPLTLKSPLNIYIYLPGAMLAAIGEWTDSRETWPVTGRVYVFGKFKKSLFSFKRCVPVELDLTMRNPLREK